jgi:hypothetical protein
MHPVHAPARARRPAAPADDHPLDIAGTLEPAERVPDPDLEAVRRLLHKLGRDRPGRDAGSVVEPLQRVEDRLVAEQRPRYRSFLRQQLPVVTQPTVQPLLVLSFPLDLRLVEVEQSVEVPVSVLGRLQRLFDEVARRAAAQCPPASPFRQVTTVLVRSSCIRTRLLLPGPGRSRGAGPFHSDTSSARAGLERDKSWARPGNRVGLLVVWAELLAVEGPNGVRL